MLRRSGALREDKLECIEGQIRVDPIHVRPHRYSLNLADEYIGNRDLFMSKVILREV